MELRGQAVKTKRETQAKYGLDCSIGTPSKEILPGFACHVILRRDSLAQSVSMILYWKDELEHCKMRTLNSKDRTL